MQTQIVTWLNFDPSLYVEEWNDEPGQTQPDEVLSIREMLVRHARGIPPNSPYGEGAYAPEELGYIPSIQEMDLSEISAARDALTKRVQQIKQKLEKDNQPNLPRGERPPEAKEKETTTAPSTETTPKEPVSEGAK